jgi:hypothetical protein
MANNVPYRLAVLKTSCARLDRFGFAQLVPQLIINYKLKSVAAECPEPKSSHIAFILFSDTRSHIGQPCPEGEANTHGMCATDLSL